jgi:hypothetical protein
VSKSIIESEASMFGFNSGAAMIDSRRVELILVELILEAKSILIKRNQTCQNQFYTFIINFGLFRSGTKHTNAFGGPIF